MRINEATIGSAGSRLTPGPMSKLVSSDRFNTKFLHLTAFSDERQPFPSAKIAAPVQAAQGGATAVHGGQKGSLLNPIASGRSASSFPRNFAVCKTAFR